MKESIVERFPLLNLLLLCVVFTLLLGGMALALVVRALFLVLLSLDIAVPCVVSPSVVSIGIFYFTYNLGMSLAAVFKVLGDPEP